MEQSLHNLQAIAEEFKCPTKDNVALVKCLRSKDALELVAAEEKLFNVCSGVSLIANAEFYQLSFHEQFCDALQSKLSLFSPHLDGLGFVPTAEAVDDDRAFIIEHPLEVIAKSGAHGVPHLMGHTSGEGILATTGRN